MALHELSKTPRHFESVEGMGFAADLLLKLDSKGQEEDIALKSAKSQ